MMGLEHEIASLVEAIIKRYDDAGVIPKDIGQSVVEGIISDTKMIREDARKRSKPKLVKLCDAMLNKITEGGNSNKQEK